MKFANLYVTFLDVVTDGVKETFDMLGFLVRQWLFDNGHDTSVVTIDSHGIQCTRNHTWVGYELLHP